MTIVWETTLHCLFAIGDIPVDTDAGVRVLLDVPATDTDA